MRATEFLLAPLSLPTYGVHALTSRFDDACAEFVYHEGDAARSRDIPQPRCVSSRAVPRLRKSRRCSRGSASSGIWIWQKVSKLGCDISGPCSVFYFWPTAYVESVPGNILQNGSSSLLSQCLLQYLISQKRTMSMGTQLNRRPCGRVEQLGTRPFISTHRLTWANLIHRLNSYIVKSSEAIQVSDQA